MKGKITNSSFYESAREIKNSFKHFIRKTFGISDYNRWKEQESLVANWEPRTALMAQYINENSTVLEFGAGKMFLKKYLPEGCTYRPSDIVDRGENTLVWDLNAKVLPKLKDKYDVMIFSGVLEYIFDIENVVNHLKGSTKDIVTSYATIEMNPEDRNSHGWVNSLTEEQFVNIFTKNGFELLKTNEWKTQRIFLFRKGNI